MKTTHVYSVCRIFNRMKYKGLNKIKGQKMIKIKGLYVKKRKIHF